VRRSGPTHVVRASMTDIDVVAEAIWEASPGTLPWREVPDDSITKGHYTRMAQAAIEALGFTEETQEEWNGLEWGTERRYVSPWFRVEEQP
jgi:hypothetical protein